MKSRDPEPSDQLRERLLVLRCQAGDEAAFADLYHEYGPRIRRYTIAILGPESAEDVLQEVWLTVFRRIREVTNPGGFRAWLFRTARHRAIDALRTERRRSRLTREAFSDVGHPSTTSSDFDGIDSDALMTAVGTLAPEHREVVQLRFFEDLSYADIAAITGCALGTVRSRIHNAKGRLRQILGDARPALNEDRRKS